MAVLATSDSGTTAIDPAAVRLVAYDHRAFNGPGIPCDVDRVDRSERDPVREVDLIGRGRHDERARLRRNTLLVDPDPVDAYILEGDRREPRVPGQHLCSKPARP